MVTAAGLIGYVITDSMLMANDKDIADLLRKNGGKTNDGRKDKKVLNKRR